MTDVANELPPQVASALNAGLFEMVPDATQRGRAFARIAGRLAPLLAERDAAAASDAQRGVREIRCQKVARDRAEEETRRLREALEEIADGRVPFIGGVSPALAAFARAALSASPVPEATPAQRVSKAVGNAIARIEAGVYGPVSVPEQEEELPACDCARSAGTPYEHDGGPCWPGCDRRRALEAAASSSSSEEGERAAIDRAAEALAEHDQHAPGIWPDLGADDRLHYIGAARKAAEALGFDELERQIANADAALDRLGAPRDDAHLGRDGLGGAVYTLSGRIEAFAAALRERLTSDEDLTSAVASSLPSSWPPASREEYATRMLATVADRLENREEGASHGD